MTRLAILADIHGNLPALDAVIEDMQPFAVDHVIVAGDSIHWGPYSAQVLERITTLGWAVIRGNAEFYLLDYGTDRAPAAWSTDGFALVKWLHAQIADQWLPVLAAWPDALSLRYPDAPPVRVCHGTPRSAWEPMFIHTPEEEMVDILAGVEETTVIAGHTHLALDRQVGRWRVLNPGTVGAPTDGRGGASWLLLEAHNGAWRPTFRRVAYDEAEVLAELERSGCLEAGGVIAQLFVQEFRTRSLYVAPFVLWHAAEHPDEALTPALLDQFTDAQRLAYMPPAYLHAEQAELVSYQTDAV